MLNHASSNPSTVNLDSIPFDPKNTKVFEALICQGTGSELALAIIVETESGYIFTRMNLRNGISSLIVELRSKDINEFNKFKDRFCLPIENFHEKSPFIFPIAHAHEYTSYQVETYIRKEIGNNLLTSSAVEGILNEPLGQDAILSISTNINAKVASQMI